MTWGALLDAAPWAALAGLVLWWLRDRRKDRAAAEVAERTVDADVAVKEVGSAEARLAFAVDAFDKERASYERRIAGLEKENRQLRSELQTQREQIAELREQAEALGRQVAQLNARLAAMDDRPAQTRGDR